MNFFGLTLFTCYVVELTHQGIGIVEHFSDFGMAVALAEGKYSFGDDVGNFFFVAIFALEAVFGLIVADCVEWQIPYEFMWLATKMREQQAEFFCIVNWFIIDAFCKQLPEVVEFQKVALEVWNWYVL